MCPWGMHKTHHHCITMLNRTHPTCPAQPADSSPLEANFSPPKNQLFGCVFGACPTPALSPGPRTFAISKIDCVLLICWSAKSPY